MASMPARSHIDFTDGALFGNDAGEDEEPDILNSYFVDQPAFSSFLSRTVAFQLARSRKGMGKSALLSKLAYDLARDEEPPLIVKVTGANLVGIEPPPSEASHLELQNYWARVICTRINYAIASRLNFAFSDNAIALVESAEIAGFKERNLVGSLIHRIKSSKIPIEANPKAAANHEELLKRVPELIPNLNVWFLVDDIDSTYIDSPAMRAVTSTFFSACRALVRDVRGLSIRASVRTDVWSNLRDNEDLDKCEQYVTDISWSAPDLEVILSKKIYSYFQRSDFGKPLIARLDYRKHTETVLEFAFARRVRWGAAMVPPFRPIHVLSAGRPRWMSQICRLAGVQAAKAGKELIGTTEINGVMKTYSRYRLNDIYKEHGHQYHGLEKLIETFSNSPARYTTDDILSQIATKYLNVVGSNNVPDIDGYPYKFPMQLAHFLFKIGFVVGRRERRDGIQGADYIRFEERPELLTDGRNPDDDLIWEIHPSYREALSVGKEAREAKGAKGKSRAPSRATRRTQPTSRPNRPLRPPRQR